MLSVARSDARSPKNAAGRTAPYSSVITSCLAGLLVALLIAGPAAAQTVEDGAPVVPILSPGDDGVVPLSPRAQRKLEHYERQIERADGADKLRRMDSLAQTYDEATNRTRVMVLMRSDGAPPEAERYQSPEARAAWQGEVLQMQNQVIRRVRSDEMTVHTLYKNIPGMVCEVTADGMAALMGDPNVEAVQADTLERRFLAQGIPLMQASGVRSAFDGSGMTIAIIDDGVDYTHPDLGGGGFPNAKVISGIDTAGAGDADPFPGGGNTHGSSVSGIACGDIPGSITSDYIGGMAPGAKIAAVKVFADGAGSAFGSDIVEGIDWCVTNQFLDPANPIMIINMSLGGGRYFSAAAAAAADPVRLASVNAAVAAGITVIAASGNDGFCDSMGVPAALAPVISVGAVYDAAFGTVGLCVDPATCFPSSGSCSGGVSLTQATGPGVVTGYSNTADFLDVFGASHNAFTPATGGGFDATFGGTSAASPYVAGAVALLQSAALVETGSFLPPETIRTILTASGSPITDTKGGGLTPGITKPLVDVEQAYLSIATGNPIQDISVSDTSLSFILPAAGIANTPLVLGNDADAGGLNVDFEISTSVEGEEEDIIGGFDFFISASNVSFGNVFQATSDTTLLGVESALSFTGPANLTFAVYQMPGLAPGDVKTRIFTTTGAFNGVGLAYYGSGPISVPLVAGNYYAIVTEWGAVSVNHYLDVNAQPAVSFGNKVLAFLFSAPLPAAFIGDLGTTTYNMHQILALGAQSWLSVDVPMGSIVPQAVQPITVTANATGFAPGTYQGELTITSNDPDESVLTLPVGLLVGLQSQVYANFGFTGAEFGTMTNPYNTLAESLAAVQSAGTISILGGGTSPETPDINQDVTIEAIGAEATIGEDGGAPLGASVFGTASAGAEVAGNRIRTLDQVGESRPLPGGAPQLMRAGGGSGASGGGAPSRSGGNRSREDDTG